MNTNTNEYTYKSSGTFFKKEANKLYRFEENRIEVVRPWPNPSAWLKTSATPSWRRFRPLKMSLLHNNLRNRLIFANGKVSALQEVNDVLRESDIDRWPKLYNASKKAWTNYTLLNFHDTVPVAVRNQVGRYATRQFHCLSPMYYVDETEKFPYMPARELSRSNAAPIARPSVFRR